MMKSTPARSVIRSETISIGDEFSALPDIDGENVAQRD